MIGPFVLVGVGVAVGAVLTWLAMRTPLKRPCVFCHGEGYVCATCHQTKYTCRASAVWGDEHRFVRVRCPACVSQTPRISIAAGLLLCLALPAFAQVDDPNTTGKDESILETPGMDPAIVEHGPALIAAARTASSQVTRMDANCQPSATGKVNEVGVGNSNPRYIFADMNILMQAAPWKPATGARFLDKGDGGNTIESWANPDHVVWTSVRNTLLQNGGICTAQWIYAGMTQFGPATRGLMTVEQLDRFVQAVIINTDGHAKGLTLTGMQWAGQTLGGLVTPYSIWHDDQIMAAYEGVKTFTVTLKSGAVVTRSIPVIYEPTYSNGYHPNPAARSNDYPDGWFATTIDSADDGVHPSNPIGRQRLAKNYLERMRQPFGATSGELHWFLWANGVTPTADAPPAPPAPTYGLLDGAQRKWLSGACTAIWGALETPLPASWCAGL